MRVTIAILALALASAPAASASADQLLVISGVAADGGHIYLNVRGAADSDGDGVPDEGIVRLQCAGGQLRAADYHVTGPRDAASGQASGKRTHHPMTIVKEWGPATPQLSQVKVVATDLPKVAPKIAKESHGRAAAEAGWQPVMLEDPATVCAGAEEAARKATKSRSNIQNN